MKKTFIMVMFFILIIPANIVHADIINGGFESGDFTGWEVIGDARVVDSSFGTPTLGGQYSALITTGANAASLHDTFSLLGLDEAKFFSGADTSSWKASAIRTTSTASNKVISIASQSFTNAATIGYYAPGSILYMFQFNNNGVGGGQPWRNGTFTASTTSFAYQSEVGYYTFTLAAEGLEFIVIQTSGDFASNGSGMLIDVIDESEYVPTIPEPTTMLLLGLGLVGLAGVRKKFRK